MKSCIKMSETLKKIVRKVGRMIRGDAVLFQCV